jgi:hypothetical protein
MQSVDGKKTRIWNGLKLTRNGNYASNDSTIALRHSENKSIKEDKEKRKMRELRVERKLGEMFKK